MPYLFFCQFKRSLFAQMNQGISDVLATCGYLMLTVATEGVQSMEEEYLLKAKSMGLAGVFGIPLPVVSPLVGNLSAAVFQSFFFLIPTLAGLPKTEQLPASWEALGDQVANYFLNPKTASFGIFSRSHIQIFFRILYPPSKHNSCRGRDLSALQRRFFLLTMLTENLPGISTKLKPLPDAIITQNCYQGAGALSALKQQGIRVPEQAAVLSPGKCSN